jgi:hypothetical protein
VLACNESLLLKDSTFNDGNYVFIDKSKYGDINTPDDPNTYLDRLKPWRSQWLARDNSLDNGTS